MIYHRKSTKSSSTNPSLASVTLTIFGYPGVCTNPRFNLVALGYPPGGRGGLGAPTFGEAKLPEEFRVAGGGVANTGVNSSLVAVQKKTAKNMQF